MCFYIHSKHRDKKIAKRDIRCYKVLKMFDNELLSPYKWFSYELGRKYTSIIFIYQGRIEEGLHSFSNKKKALSERYSWYKDIYKVFICEIPKGSEYYYSPSYKEYVSNQLIVKEEL